MPGAGMLVLSFTEDYLSHIMPSSHIMRYVDGITGANFRFDFSPPPAALRLV